MAIHPVTKGHPLRFKQLQTCVDSFKAIPNKFPVSVPDSRPPSASGYCHYYNLIVTLIHMSIIQCLIINYNDYICKCIV